MEGLARDAAMATSIVQLAAAGDTVAFARIVAAYHADMIRVAYVVSGGDQDIADDAVQAAWSIAWRKLGSLRDPDRLKPWLVSVAANEARQLCRQAARRGRWSSSTSAWPTSASRTRASPTRPSVRTRSTSTTRCSTCRPTSAPSSPCATRPASTRRRSARSSGRPPRPSAGGWPASLTKLRKELSDA